MSETDKRPNRMAFGGKLDEDSLLRHVTSGSARLTPVVPIAGIVSLRTRAQVVYCGVVIGNESGRSSRNLRR